MKKSFFFLAGLLLLSACGEQQAQQAETEYKTLVVSLSVRTKAPTNDVLPVPA